MSILSAIFWGIIQGLGEFLPISSSGHLAILQNIFHMENIEEQFTFNILLHFGTLIAVFIVYYRDIFALIPAFFTMLGKFFRGKFKLTDYNLNERFVLFILIATLPMVAAVFVNDYVEMLCAYTKVIGIILIFNGGMLLLSDWIASHRRTELAPEEIKGRHAFFVGLIQMCAVVPGISRSGSTITGGLLMGFPREYAVKFSFILSIPAILGANILSIGDLVSNPVPQSDLMAYASGMIAAALTGIAAIKLLIYISKKANFRFFGYYCIVVGILTAVFG